jgi:hypothetical protein
METQERVFVRAVKLFDTAYDTAKAALVEAGPAGIQGRKLFELCQEECRQQVPSLDYDEELFRMTLQDLHQRNWTTFRVEYGGLCVLSR